MNTRKIKELYFKTIGIMFIILNVFFIGHVNAATKELDVNEAIQLKTKASMYILAKENSIIRKEHEDWLELTAKEIAEIDKNGNKEVDTIDILILKQHILAMKNSKVKEQHPEWIIYVKNVENPTPTTQVKPTPTTPVNPTPTTPVNPTPTTPVKPVVVNVTKLQLNKSTLTIQNGKTYSLNATVLPTNSTDKSITWSSSDTKIATVDSKGKILAKKAGTAKITVKSKNGKTAVCNLTVKPLKTTIELENNVLMIDNMHYDIADLDAKIKQDGQDVSKKYKVKWSIDNSNIASIKEQSRNRARITGKNYGKTKITAKLKIDGKEIKATCNLKVIVKVEEKTGKDGEYSYNSNLINSTYYIIRGNWGNDYVEAYVNNAAKMVKRYPNYKHFKDESGKEKITCYQQKDLNIKYDNKKKIIKSMSANHGYGVSRSAVVKNNSNFTKREFTKRKGELTPNGYVLLFTHKNQWLYLLKYDNKAKKYKMVYSKQSSAGYDTENFNKYLSIMYYNNEGQKISLTFKRYRESNNTDTYQNSVHYCKISDYEKRHPHPTSHGCIHAGTLDDDSMYYHIIKNAGVGTRLILF